MAWIQLRALTDASHAEPLSDLLSQLGAGAVTFMDADDHPILEPAPGEIRYWPNTWVIGLFEADCDTAALAARIEQSLLFPHIRRYKFEQLEDKDWEREWMENFKPMRFGRRLWICPSWHQAPDPDAVNVMLDPGLAFGTGSHATTALCLEWLDSQPLENKTVVDFGCGSGILAIAALKLGAARVIGIDIDPQALQASADNARRNHVADRLALYLPDQAPAIEADVLVANILAEPLRQLQPAITALLRPGGRLALSGILAHQAADIRQRYQHQCDMDEAIIRDDWAMLGGRKRQSPDCQ